jgi:predicted GNAT superfamily acetyltransferase
VDVVIGEWWLTRNRAEERLLGKRNSLTLSQYLDANTPIVNPSWARSNGMQAEPHTGPLQGEAGVLLLVEVPADYSVILHTDKNLASAWRQHSREVFREVFEQGYVATDFLHEPYQGRDRSFYLMSYDGPRSGAEI